MGKIIVIPFLTIDYEAIVKLSDGFNGADLRNVCTEAGKLKLFNSLEINRSLKGFLHIFTKFVYGLIGTNGEQIYKSMSEFSYNILISFAKSCLFI